MKETISIDHFMELLKGTAPIFIYVERTEQSVHEFFFSGWVPIDKSYIRDGYSYQLLYMYQGVEINTTTDKFGPSIYIEKFIPLPTWKGQTISTGEK